MVPHETEEGVFECRRLILLDEEVWGPRKAVRFHRRREQVRWIEPTRHEGTNVGEVECGAHKMK